MDSQVWLTGQNLTLPSWKSVPSRSNSGGIYHLESSSSSQRTFLPSASKYTKATLLNNKNLLTPLPLRGRMHYCSHLSASSLCRSIKQPHPVEPRVAYMSCFDQWYVSTSNMLFLSRSFKSQLMPWPSLYYHNPGSGPDERGSARWSPQSRQQGEEPKVTSGEQVDLLLKVTESWGPLVTTYFCINQLIYLESLLSFPFPMKEKNRKKHT